MSVNVITISGNLTHDPEVKATTGEKQTSVCRFRIAVNEYHGGQESTFFITCVAFGRQAENLERYIKKGNQVTVVGRLSIREYERNDGTKAYFTEVIANQVEYMRQPRGGSAPKQTTEEVVQQEFNALPEDLDDEIPFR